MSVFVDPLRPCWPTKIWKYDSCCHLVTDSHCLDELHEFAEKIGLKRAWFQQHPLLPHYDLTPNKRKEAIAAGAQAISFNRLYKIIEQRKERNNGMPQMSLGDQGQGFAPEEELGLSQA